MMNVGTAVAWESQAQGNVTRKQGEIIEVLEAGKQPDQTKYPSLYRGGKIGRARKEPSYVVKVGTRYYWPHATQLTADTPTQGTH